MDVGEVPEDERVLAARSFKEEGNVLFQNGKVEKAVKKYHVALIQLNGIEMQPTKGEEPSSVLSFLLPQEREHSHKELLLKEAADRIRVPCYNNLAACMSKLENWEKAINYASAALRIDEHSTKALERRGRAHYYDRKFDNALEDFLAVLKNTPNAGSIERFVEQTRQQIRIADEKYRKVYATMLK